MLEPTSRFSLVDLLRPPDGYRLDAAVGTTYSLDYLALTAVVLGLIDASVDDRESLNNPHEVLRALTGLADRVRVLVDRSHISAEGVERAPRIISLYDAMVQEVRLRKASFHPKVWAALFVPRKTVSLRDSRPVVRLLCSSRNITKSENWDLFVCLEGIEGRRKLGSGMGPEAAGFIGSLAEFELARRRGPFERVANALRHTPFALPREMAESGRFLWHVNGGSVLDALRPKKGTEVLVVSPFITATFLRGLLDGFDTVRLITTRRQLDAITDDDLHCKLKEHQEVFVVGADAHDSEDFTSLDLHAKLFSFETPDGSVTFLGSANASDRAWKQNSEAVVAMKPGFSPKYFAERFCYADDGGLQGWLVPYERNKREETPEERAEKAVDDARDALAEMTLTARYEQRSGSIILKARRIPAELPKGVTVRVWPLGRASKWGRGHTLADLAGGGARYSGASLADLSEFVVIEVQTSRPRIVRSFVLKATVQGSRWRSRRDQAVLNDAVTREVFVQFLRNILFDGSTPVPVPLDRGIKKGKGQRSSATPSLLSNVSMEDVLKQCSQDPSRVDDIQRLLDAFARTDHVDGTFRAFWQRFRAAWATSGIADQH